MSAMAPIAGSAAAVAMLFIGWLPHQVITEPNLRLAVQTSRLDQLKMMRERIKLTRVRPSRASTRSVRQSAPFLRRHPHPLGKHRPKCRNRLISNGLGHSFGADRRLLQLVGGQTHAEIGQQIEGGATEPVLKVPHERGPRHAAQIRQIRQFPRPRWIGKHRLNGWSQSRISSQGQQAFGRFSGFAAARRTRVNKTEESALRMARPPALSPADSIRISPTRPESWLNADLMPSSLWFSIARTTRFAGR
jgi:hypothetical protein